MIVRDDNLATDALAIVEKYEAFVRYLYPILQRCPRQHGVIRDTVLTALFAGVPIAMMVLGVVQSPEWFTMCLWTGLGIGVAVFVAGLLLGAIAYNRRGPEIMAFALRNA